MILAGTGRSGHPIEDEDKNVWRYLREAFWARPEIAGLGRVPVNLILLAGVGILGFGEHALWLAGLGAEVAYLYS